MADTKRPISVELHITNESEFMAEITRIASEATAKMQLGARINVSSAPGAFVPPSSASSQSAPMFMGQGYNTTVRMPTAAEHIQATATLPNGVSARGLSPAQFMQSNAQFTQITQQLQQFATRTMAALNTQLHGESLQLVNDLKRYAGQLATMGERGQAGMRVNPMRLNYLQERVQALGEQIQARHQQFLSQNSPQQLAGQAANLKTQLEAQYALPIEKRNTELISGLRSDVDKLLGTIKTSEAFDRASATQQYAQTMAGTIPPSAYGASTPAQQYQIYHSRARSVLGTMLPAFASYLTIKGLGQSYQFASGLAESAGALSMQTGATMNPTQVYNRLLSQGRSQGISATQLASASQLQGEFSGTGNIAFLFKDAQQTAQFARSMGISQGIGAQIMGSYQLGGAFSAGNEAGTSAQIMAAAGASGMNTQAFMQGVLALAQSAQRTGIQVGGGVATSLSMTSQLGNALGMNLFQGSNAAQSLQTLQAGFSAGPGQQSGLMSAQLLPIYLSALHAVSPMYTSAGITNPTLQMVSLTQSSLASNPKMLKAVLGGIHQQLAGASGAMKQLDIMGFSQFLFGNQSIASVKNVAALGGPGYASAMAEATKRIQANAGHGAKSNTEYLHSIAGDVSKIETNVQRIASATGKPLVQMGGAVAPGLGAHPGLTAGIGLGLDALGIGAGYGITQKGFSWLGGKLGLKWFGGGGGGGGATASEEAASGLVDHLGRPLSTAAADSAGASRTLLSRFGGLATKLMPGAEGALRALPIVGGLASIGLSKATGHSWGSSIASGIGGTLGGMLGALVPVPGLDIATSAGGAMLGSWAGNKVYDLFSGHHATTAAGKHVQAAIHAAQSGGSVSAPALGAAQTLSLVAEVGKEPGFQAFVNAFLKNGYLFGGGAGSGGANANSSLAGAGIGSVGPGLNPPAPGTVLPSVTGGGGSIPGGALTSAPGGIKQWMSLINKYAKKSGDPASVIAGIMAQESSGNPYAINDNTAGRSWTNLTRSQYLSLANQLIAKGDNIDMGLMQINQHWHPNVTPAEAANPNFAINFAAHLLKGDYQAMGGHSWNNAIRSYNAGVGGAQAGGGYTYLQDVLAHMSSMKTGARKSARHNVNRKNTRYKMHA